MDVTVRVRVPEGVPDKVFVTEPLRLADRVCVAAADLEPVAPVAALAASIMSRRDRLRRCGRRNPVRKPLSNSAGERSAKTVCPSV